MAELRSLPWDFDIKLYGEHDLCAGTYVHSVLAALGNVCSASTNIFRKGSPLYCACVVRERVRQHHSDFLLLAHVLEKNLLGAFSTMRTPSATASAVSWSEGGKLVYRHAQDRAYPFHEGATGNRTGMT